MRRRKAIVSLFAAFCLCLFGAAVLPTEDKGASAASYSYTFDGTEDYSTFEMTDGWAINNGVLERKSGGGDGFVWLNHITDSDVTFSFTFKMTGTSAGSGNDYGVTMVTRNTDKSSWLTSNRMIMRSPLWSVAASGNFAEAYSGLGGVVNGTTIGGFKGFNENQTYNVKGVFVGTRAQMTVDGIVVLDAIVPAGTAGNVGFNSWNAYCEIDGLTVSTGTESDFTSMVKPTEFVSDFSENNGRLKLDGGWVIADGVLKRTTGEGDGFVWTDLGYPNVKVDLKLKPLSLVNADSSFSVVAGNSDAADWTASNYLGIRTKEWLHAASGNFVEGYSGLGTITGNTKIATFDGMVNNTVYTLSAVFYGTRMQLSVDGTLLIDATVPQTTGGRIGLNSWNMYCEVDDLSVKEALESDLLGESTGGGDQDGSSSGGTADEYFFDFAEGGDVSALSMDGGWAVNNGVLERKLESGDGFVWLNNSSDWTDVRFEFDFKPVHCTAVSGKDYNLSVVADNNDPANWQKSFYVVLRPTDWDFACNFVELYSGRGLVQNSVSTGFSGFTIGETYRVEVVFFQTRVLVFVDGTQVLNATSEEGSGRVGINSWNLSCELDNLTVEKATAEDVEDVPELPVGESKDSYFFDFSDPAVSLVDLSLDNGWKIEDGVLKRNSGEGDGFVWLTSRKIWADSVFSFKLKFMGDCGTKDYALSVVYRKLGASWQNSNYAMMRAVDWSPDDGAPFGMNFVELGNGKDFGDESLIDSVGASSFTGFVVGQTYEIKAMMIGNRILLYVDGALVLDAASLLHSFGEVGFNSWNAYVEIDDLTVRVPTQEELDATPAFVPEVSTGDGPLFIDPGKDAYWETATGEKKEKGWLFPVIALGVSVVSLLVLAFGFFGKKKEGK
ncbi:MAG: hypothetical protein IJY62_00080 [Clostridia bacterium]|nr:hypothetical protein [Clostridia bacterium]